MTVALVVANVLVVVAFLTFADRRERLWSAERRELLTRIQHPTLVPVERARSSAVSAPEPDEFDLVGVRQEPT